MAATSGENSRLPFEETLPRCPAVRRPEAPPSGSQRAGAVGSAAGWATASVEARNSWPLQIAFLSLR